MMTSSMPFGLFELDEAGTIVQYSPPTEEARNGSQNGIVGSDFFKDVAPMHELKDLKSRFLRFMTFGDSVERFSMSFPVERSVVKVQIILARIFENSNDERKRFALVRIMPDELTASRET
jgi:photoactive yellow protein